MFSKVGESEMCPCKADIMTAEHLLQHYWLHDTLRRDMWPEPIPLRDRLYGNMEELRRSAAFMRVTGIPSRDTMKKTKSGIKWYMPISMAGMNKFSWKVCMKCLTIKFLPHKMVGQTQLITQIHMLLTWIKNKSNSCLWISGLHH